MGEKGIKIILEKQRGSGLWDDAYQKGNGADDVETSVWQLRALRSGVHLGMTTDELAPALRRAAGAMETAMAGNAGSIQNGPICYSLIFLGYGREAACKTGMKPLEDLTMQWGEPPFPNPIYHWHFITQLKFALGGEQWKQWNKSFAPTLVRNQTIENEEGRKGRGCWVSPGTNESYGPVYSTAMCALMLQVYYCGGPYYDKGVPVREKHKEDDDVIIGTDVDVKINE